MSLEVFGGGRECTDALGNEFRKAVDEKNTGWLEINRWDWEQRKDLFDYVIEKSVDVTVWFIQNVGRRERQCVLAALFDKGEGMIDDVLGKVEYNDFDLYDLTEYRPELAGSPEKFFKILDRIEDPRSQGSAVHWGVNNLLRVGRHDLVAPLVDALGKRTFKIDRLKEVAIQQAFYKGTKWGNQDIVAAHYEHPAITSEKYALGLYWSWNKGKPSQVFQFLLDHADQDILELAKKKYTNNCNDQLRQIIDNAIVTAPHTGSRHHHPIEGDKQGAKLATNTLDAALGTEKGHQEPSNIIASHLVGEEEWTKEREPGMAHEAEQSGNHTY